MIAPHENLSCLNSKKVLPTLTSHRHWKVLPMHCCLELWAILLWAGLGVWSSHAQLGQPGQLGWIPYSASAGKSPSWPPLTAFEVQLHRLHYFPPGQRPRLSEAQSYSDHGSSFDVFTQDCRQCLLRWRGRSCLALSSRGACPLTHTLTNHDMHRRPS